jgi:OFA family oxalate/formate antiporter-like MFS transporter
MAVGSSVMVGSVLIASLCTSWGWFLFFFGFCFPAGIGTVYWVPIICGWEWFPSRKGLVSGLTIGGYGFGSFFFGFLTSAIANPHNLAPELPKDDSGDTDLLFPAVVGEQVPRMFRLCLIFWALQALAASLLV